MLYLKYKQILKYINKKNTLMIYGIEIIKAKKKRNNKSYNKEKVKSHKISVCFNYVYIYINCIIFWYLPNAIG